MITAVVLINAAVDAIPEIAEQVSEIDGVTEVYSVAGDVDLVAMVRVNAHEDLWCRRKALTASRYFPHGSAA